MQSKSENFESIIKQNFNQLLDKYQFLIEYDYHMEDVVIEFPNPDSPKCEDLRILTQLEAIQ
ncbi:unnamed protein product [Paramecium pentaurelia]|uniref:Uncharacterized protein n=1 Tax=Paramecium pentaurelia TaxID=43138 RepID=A0A8S1WWF6_9CILI|nr:unnamed protein product [Paramecium pentaurelia]